MPKIEQEPQTRPLHLTQETIHDHLRVLSKELKQGEWRVTQTVGSLQSVQPTMEHVRFTAEDLVCTGDVKLGVLSIRVSSEKEVRIPIPSERYKLPAPLVTMSPDFIYISYLEDNFGQRGLSFLRTSSK